MPPRLARLLAIVVAVILVVAAFALRGALADDDGTAGGPSGDPADPGSGAPFRVLCDDDLGRACDELRGQEGIGSVEVMRAGDALAALADDPDAYDAWLTLDPWPAIAAYRADPGATSFPDPEVVPVASAALAGLVDPEASACEDTPSWTCLSRPTRPPVGLPGMDTALGPLALAHAAVGLVGSTTFGINGIDPVRLDVLAALVEDGAGGRSAAALVDQIVLPGSYSAVITTQGLATAIAVSPGGSTLDLVSTVLDPQAAIGVVLAGLGARGPDALDALEDVVTGQTVRQALISESWSGPAARSSGLPDPDVIYALKEELA